MSENDVLVATLNNVARRKGGVTVSRKVGLPNYSSADVSVYIEVNLDGATSAEEEAARIESAVSTAKCVVYNELGIEYAVDENGVVREVQPKAPAPRPTVEQVVANVEKAFPGTTSADGNFDIVVEGQVAPLPDWLNAAYAAKGSPGVLVDNRNPDGTGKKSAKGTDQPHFRSKFKVNGNDVPFWPPSKGR